MLEQQTTGDFADYLMDISDQERDKQVFLETTFDQFGPQAKKILMPREADRRVINSLANRWKETRPDLMPNIQILPSNWLGKIWSLPWENSCQHSSLVAFSWLMSNCSYDNLAGFDSWHHHWISQCESNLLIAHTERKRSVSQNSLFNYTVALQILSILGKNTFFHCLKKLKSLWPGGRPSHTHVQYTKWMVLEDLWSLTFIYPIKTTGLLSSTKLTKS